MAFVSKVYAKPKLKACLSVVHKGFVAWQCCQNCSLPNKKTIQKKKKKVKICVVFQTKKQP